MKNIFLLALCLLTISSLGSVIPYSIGKFDRDLGWSLQENAIASSNETGEVIEYKIDSLGLRAINQIGSLSSCSLAALGDSNTFGYGISIDEHWLTRLNESMPKLRIFNLGVSAYGIDQYFLRYLKFQKELGPKYVLIFVKHFHEYRHMRAYRFGRAKPYFSKERTGLIVYKDHVVKLEKFKWLDYLKMHSEGVQDIFARITNLKKNSYDFGLVIAKEMENQIIKDGAIPIFVTVMNDFCKDGLFKYCKQLKEFKYPLISSKGINLNHINAKGSRLLASRLKEFFIKEELMKECF